MLDESSRGVKIAVVDIVVVVVSSCDERPFPRHRDGVGSGARFNHMEVAACRWGLCEKY